MAERIKTSRYNHFVPLENGNRLAFNALTCGLAEMDPPTYRQYCDLIAIGETDGENHNDLTAQLKTGGFVIPEDYDELDAIRAGHFRTRFGGRGLGLTIIPTSICNFACDYCYESRELHSRIPEEGGMMSEQICSRIVKLCEKQIEPNSGLNITWYGGEPLLARPIIDRLSTQFHRICETSQAQYHAGMITNGFLLDAAAIQFLQSVRVTFVQVTIDGPKDVHDLRRFLKSGRGTFRRIMSNLENVDESKGIGVAIRINVDMRNAQDIPCLLREFRNRGWHNRRHFSFHFGQIVTVNNSCPDIGNQCMLTPAFSEFMIQAYQAALEMGFRHADYPVRHSCPCSAVGSGSFVIEPDGTVQSCWNTIGDPTRSTGELTDEGIRPNNNYLKWLGWSPFDNNGVCSCGTCNLLPVCMGGCPYKWIYRQDALPIETANCVPHRYNLPGLLRIVYRARNKGLLTVDRMRATGRPAEK
jgi:uncharacterized protein